MQAAARKAAAPLPPVVLPPAQAAMADPAAASSSHVAAAAVANLGLQIPVEVSPMDAVSGDGPSTETVPLLEQAALLSDARHDGGLPDDTLNEPVMVQA
jgi:hypothetical protein